MAVSVTKCVKHFYVKPLHVYSPHRRVDEKISKIDWEFCYNVEISAEDLKAEDAVNLKWLMNAQIFAPTTTDSYVTEVSQLQAFRSEKLGSIIEIGPR